MNEQLAMVVGIVKNQKGEILIARRTDPEFPEADGHWEFIGGHIEFGESPEAAVIREAKEESGLDVQIVRLLPKVPNNLWTKADGNRVQTILIYYECLMTGGSLNTKHDSKISELKFIDPKTIHEYNTLPETKDMVEVMLKH